MKFKGVYPKEIFVYLLLKNNQVIYVGQTTNGINRIKQHFVKKEIEFDEYRTIKCSKKELNNLEDFYIIKYQPKYNIKINSSVVKSTYIIHKIKDIIGFNPYSIKRIDEIIEKTPFEKFVFKKGTVLKKENAEAIADFCIKNYIDENAKIEDYFEKIG